MGTRGGRDTARGMRLDEALRAAVRPLGWRLVSVRWVTATRVTVVLEAAGGRDYWALDTDADAASRADLEQQLLTRVLAQVEASGGAQSPT